jgi:hypothetical protein
MTVDTDSLRWFQQVADGTTVTEVSELEAVTQSGVSRRPPGGSPRSPTDPLPRPSLLTGRVFGTYCRKVCP